MTWNRPNIVKKIHATSEDTTIKVQIKITADIEISFDDYVVEDPVFEDEGFALAA